MRGLGWCWRKQLWSQLISTLRIFSPLCLVAELRIQKHNMERAIKVESGAPNYWLAPTASSNPCIFLRKSDLNVYKCSCASSSGKIWKSMHWNGTCAHQQRASKQEFGVNTQARCNWLCLKIGYPGIPNSNGLETNCPYILTLLFLPAYNPNLRKQREPACATRTCGRGTLKA